MKIQANVTEFLHIYQNLYCDVLYQGELIETVIEQDSYISITKKDRKTIVLLKNDNIYEFDVLLIKKTPRIEDFSVLGGK